jgi:glucan phosphoethanolaminetransferase (alkaline phosphatase superfamily)
MKKLIYSLVTITSAMFIWCLVFYVGTSLVVVEYDPTLWSESTRFLFLYMGIFIGFLFGILLDHIIEDV